MIKVQWEEFKEKTRKIYVKDQTEISVLTNIIKYNDKVKT